ncbi:MAG TPA: hypothetical protein VFT55_05700 [Planctomycetota bacterium]|nr:hypothetical protein [Planctomycetota bacterium]
MSEPALPAPRRFRYLRDPLFLTAVALYAVNRFAIKPCTSPGGFFHCWFNDLICVPFWLPPILGTMRALALRDHDAPPSQAEIALLVAAWSLVFEAIVPRTPLLHSTFPHAVGDPLDVFFYVVGALIAGVVWRSGSAPLSAGSGRSDPRQHVRWALAIVVATQISTVAVLAPDQWRTSNRTWGLRQKLEGFAGLVEKERKAKGQLPAALSELEYFRSAGMQSVYEREAKAIEYVNEGSGFVLIHLGNDGARGGIRDDADVWWPAARQPDDPWYAFALSPDTTNAVVTGSGAGLLFALVWLLWRGMRTPRFPHLTKADSARAVAQLAVLLGFTLFVLYLQNGFSEAVSQGSH